MGGTFSIFVMTIYILESMSLKVFARECVTTYLNTISDVRYAECALCDVTYSFKLVWSNFSSRCNVRGKYEFSRMNVHEAARN